MKIKSLNNFINGILLIALAITLSSCKGAGGGDGEGFAGLAEGEIAAPTPTPSAPSGDTTLSINTYTPLANPYTIGNSTDTFAISVNGSGSIVYDFELNAVPVQSGASPFYNLNGTALTPGAYTLLARATNSVNSVSYTFNIIKNTAPSIDTSNPVAGSYNLDCGVDNRVFDMTTSDVNTDPMTYTWLLNGVPAPTEIGVVDTANSSTATLTPTCALNGTYTITGQVTDGIDTTSTSWTVIIGNPNVATIDAIAPSAGPLTVLSTTGTQNITISASGTPPISYAWELDSVPVGSNSATYAFTEATPGSYTVDIVVTDATTNDSASIVVVKNGKPVLSNVSPTSSTPKLNYESVQIFAVDGTDPNGDGMTYTWKLNGAVDAKLVGAPTAGGSQGTFTPDDTILGTQTISVDVSDGLETTTQVWSVTVNRFRDSCNNLSADEVCTLYGATGIGDGATTGSGDALANSSSVALDGAGGYFVTGEQKGVVWYVNKTGSSQVRLGVTIPDGQMKVVVGMNAHGKSPEGLTGRSYKLYNPQSVVWHSGQQAIFIADYNNHRVVRVDSTGVARSVIGYGGTANSTAVHADGLNAQVHAVRNPYGLALHEASNTLYVASYYHYIKKFDISDADFNNWTGEVVVGIAGGGGAIGASFADGATGYAGAARTYYPTSLAVSSDNKYLFFLGRQYCRLRVANMDSSSVEFFGITTNAGEVGTLTPNNCGNFHEGAITSARFNQAYSNALALHEDAGVVKGFFVSGYYNHEVHYYNSSGASQTFGGQVIPDDNVGRVLGLGTSTSTGDGGLGKNANVYYPRGVAVDANKLYVSEYYGARIRTLDISIANGLAATDSYFTAVRQYVENVNPGEAINYDLSGLKYNPNNNKMYLTSYASGRIQSINTVTGQTTWELGRGNSSVTQYGGTTPSLAYVSYPRAPTIVDDVLFFVNWNNPGANRSCNVGAYNDTGADITLFGTTVSNGKLQHMAGGTNAEGCAAWSPAYEGNPAVSTILNSGYGMDYVNNSELIYSDYRDHCIKSIDNAGNITSLVGLCGTGGNVQGLYNDASIRIYYPHALKEDPLNPGNFFFIDYSNQSTYGYVRYVNRSASTVTINSIPVLAGFMQTVYTLSGGYAKGIALKDDWMCFTSGHEYAQAGAHNVQCVERSTGTINRIGPVNGDLFRNAMAYSNEEEGIGSSLVRLDGPWGIEFDGDGNLWIAEYHSARIRMVKKWW